MNIFVLDTDIKKCAEYHVNAHVIKMVTESTQMLSMCNRHYGYDEGYKITHFNHPCSKWVRESLSNWLWLRDLVIALNDEYKFRYNPKQGNHKAYMMATILSVPKNMPDKGLTPFALAMPDQYKHYDVVQAYRQYYIAEKQHIAKWKKRNKPEWYSVESN